MVMGRFRAKLVAADLPPSLSNNALISFGLPINSPRNNFYLYNEVALGNKEEPVSSANLCVKLMHV